MAKQIQGKYKRRQWTIKPGQLGRLSSTAGEIVSPSRSGRGWSKRFRKKKGS